MKALRKSSDGKPRKVTPPSPSYMSNDQFGMESDELFAGLAADRPPVYLASYLSQLRNNRVARPGGARPQPSGARPVPTTASTGRYSLDASSQAESVSARSGHQRVQSNAPSTTVGSVSSRYSAASGRGRDYYPSSPTKPPLKASEVVPSATYIERGQRWMEKEEAYSLRDAMEEMDLRDVPAEPADDEARLYNAALDEASELVWQHRNGGPVAPPQGAYSYRPHLRKDSYSHARTASVGAYGDDIAASGLARNHGSRSVSGSSSKSSGSRRSRPSVDMDSAEQPASRTQKPYGSVGNSSRQVSGGRRRSSTKRNISGEVDRPFSGDQIWEEPDAAPVDRSAVGAAPEPGTLASKSQNPGNHVRFAPSRENVSRIKAHNKVEIHRNPPTRSRNAQYTTNTPSPPPTSDEIIQMNTGVEIRSQAIRDATSMRMRDRNPRLPEPTAVSDTPGRPIVSFDSNWRASNESTDVNSDRQAAAAASPYDPRQQPAVQPLVIPSIVVQEDDARQSQPPSNTSIPVISIAEDGAVSVPTIAIDDTPSGSSAPTIVLPDNQSAGTSRPLPTPGAKGSRPRIAQRPRRHWSPAPGSTMRGTTLCHECGFPIEGRFVALGGSQERFHPQCFRCYSCGIGLEALEISPEPEQVRKERLERIHCRDAGETLEEIPGMTMVEDGDDRLRFFCHLDWHELFAPRCKHCRTPIIGEHIVALGEHWHYGHFFCAECGDPFEHGMTHIEKDEYAWCINCQTKRTERRAPKCRKCRTAVIGQYIQALGGEWHDHCFRCAECQGGFDDGQIFPKEVQGGTVVLCTGCRSMELKR